MPRPVWISPRLIISLSMLAFAFAAWGAPHAFAQSPPPTSEPGAATPQSVLRAAMPALQPGDVVLIGTDLGWMRTAARWSSPDRRFGHAGIVVPVIGGDPVIINAHGTPFARKEPVEFDSLTAFLEKQTRVGVYRPRDQALAARMAEAAMHYLDKRYSFDALFTLETRDDIYCTELVWRVLIDASGADPFPEKPVILGRRAIPFTLIESSPIFEEVFFADAEKMPSKTVVASAPTPP